MNDSVSPVAPFPTHRLCRVGISLLSSHLRSPRWRAYRYYEATKTSYASSRQTYSFVCRYFSKTASFAHGGGQSPPPCPDVVQPVSSPSPAHFSKRRRWISLVPWQPSCAFALLSDPGRPNTARPSYRHIGVVYLLLTQQTPTISHFSGLYHTASALAVYASCPPLGELRNTRFRLAGLPLPDGYRTR